MLPIDEKSTPATPSAEHKPDALDASEIYACYARPLFAFVLRRVGNPFVAEELVQDVFVRALTDLSRYEERGYPIGAWLYKIAACRAIDWLRRNDRRPCEALWQADGVISDFQLDDELDSITQEEERQALLAALAQLTTGQAAVIRLRFEAELPIAEVAEQLGITQQNVKSLQHRAVTKLRLLLAEHPAFAVG